jgi:hypothetical protein
MSDVADDVFLVPVEVAETRSTFAVVQLRAGSMQEAQERALKRIEQLCRDDRLDELFSYPGGDWEHEEFDCRGIAEVQGVVEDYNVDIDLTKEGTGEEQRLAVAQTALPIEGD